MKKYLLIKIIIALLFTTSLFAETTRFDSLINVGINQIYSLEFKKAENTFQIVQQEFPKHPAGKFFDAMIIWWKIMLDQDNEKFDEQFEDKLEKVIDFCDDLLDEDDENIDAIFFKGGALGFRGRLYSVRKEWFDAALDGKDALPLVYEAYEIDPTNEDVKLGFGIYNYYAEAIPEKYPFIKPAMIFFPSGDRKKGIEQLKTASEKAKYAAIESRFFLMNLYYQFEENYNEAQIYAEALNKDFPNNPIFEKYVGRIQVKKGRYSLASKVFGSIKEKSEKGIPGYNKTLLREANYYIGVNNMNKSQIDAAMQNFKDCERLSKEIDDKDEEESGFLINSIVYQARIYEKKGDTGNAKLRYKELLKLRDYSNSHKKAKTYLNKKAS